MTSFLGILAWVMSLGALHAQDNDSRVMPLFQSDEALTLYLTADFKDVFSSKDDTTWYPATMSLTDNDGQVISIDLNIQPRGKTRREHDVCTFKPLRLDFPKKQTKNTPFEGQKAIKLVTHCNKPDFNEQNIIIEYLIYRTFNLLTDSSFKVKPAFISYIQTGKKPDTLQRFAFFLEKEKHLAERLGGIEIESEKIHPLRTDASQACLVDMFQYMIGNTDYSMYEQHNIILVSDSARARPPVPVPYDFDWSGLVGATYAEPHPLINTEDVSERVYRGFKKDPDIVYHTIDVFNQKKVEIYRLFEDCEWLDNGRRKKALDYLDGFYWIINNEKRVYVEFFERARIVHD